MNSKKNKNNINKKEWILKKKNFIRINEFVR
jgi:hypothetical protein